MTEVLHGLLSGLVWSAILGTCLCAIDAVVTAMAQATASAKNRRWNHSRLSSTSNATAVCRFRAMGLEALGPGPSAFRA
jgi:hypothetical protein